MRALQVKPMPVIPAYRSATLKAYRAKKAKAKHAWLAALGVFSVGLIAYLSQAPIFLAVISGLCFLPILIAGCNAMVPRRVEHVTYKRRNHIHVRISVAEGYDCHE